MGDAAWDYGRLDVVADLAALPFGDRQFDAAIHIVTLEHLPEPARALAEIARSLSPGGRLLLAAPHEWEVHQAPHDYFRYTRYGLRYLLEKAGFEVVRDAAGGQGIFRLLARRLLNGLQFFSGGVRWLGFFPPRSLLVPPALILPFLDFLDSGLQFHTRIHLPSRASAKGRASEKVILDGVIVVDKPEGLDFARRGGQDTPHRRHEKRSATWGRSTPSPRECCRW